jgi:hypothetical protein
VFHFGKLQDFPVSLSVTTRPSRNVIFLEKGHDNMSFINSNVGSSSNIQCDAQPAIQEKAGKNSSHVGFVTHKLAK